MGMGSRLKMQIMVTHPPHFEKPYERFLLERWNDTNSWDILRADTWAVWPLAGTFSGFYFSPPTCLYIDPGNAAPDKYALCNLAETLDLKNGKMITFVRIVLAGVGWASFYIGVTGAGSTGLEFRIGRAAVGVWERWLIKWKQGVDGVGDPKTLVTWSQWPPGEDEPAAAWAYYAPMTGSTNRCGVGASPQSLGRNKYFDDTEIWLKPS